jgi:hypothetical protein
MMKKFFARCVKLVKRERPISQSKFTAPIADFRGRQEKPRAEAVPFRHGAGVGPDLPATHLDATEPGVGANPPIHGGQPSTSGVRFFREKLRGGAEPGRPANTTPSPRPS